MNRLAATVGVAAAVGGLALVAFPGLAGGTPPTYVVVAGIAVLALIEGVNAVADLVRGERRQAAVEAVERPRQYGTPGDGFDAAITSLARARGETRGRSASDVRERLESTAVAVLEAEGMTEAEAVAALEAGTWTDDPHAAAFFAPEAVDASLARRLRDAVRRESTFRYRARRVAARLAERRGP